MSNILSVRIFKEKKYLIQSFEENSLYFCCKAWISMYKHFYKKRERDKKNKFLSLVQKVEVGREVEKEKGLFGKNISILQIHLQPHFYTYLTASVFQTLFKKHKKVNLFLLT